MKWIGCCALGLLVGFALGRYLPSEEEGTGALSALGEPLEDEAPREGPALDVREESHLAAPAAIRAPVSDATGLAVGQGLVLATGTTVTGERLAEADVIVADILQQSIWLKTPHGSAGGALPIGAIHQPRTNSALAAAFDSAPAELPDPSRVLERGPLLTAIAFIRDSQAQVHLVWIETLVQHEEVLRRRVRLAARPVDAVEGGGIAKLATAVEGDIEGVSTRTLEAIARRGAAVPGHVNSRLKKLGEAPKLIQDPDRLKRIDDRSGPLVLTKRFDREVTVGNNAIVIAAGGDGPQAKIKTESHGVLVILGDLEGSHTLGAHAYVHVTGDVLGEVAMEHHATLVVEGDVRGTVRPGAWTKLVLHGTFRGRLDVGEKRSATWPVFVYDRYVSQDEMTRLPKAGEMPRLYVRDSDLAEGKHRGVHGWDTVHVGGAFWKTLGR